jgi:hypothetical protein
MDAMPICFVPWFDVVFAWGQAKDKFGVVISVHLPIFKGLISPCFESRLVF